MGKLYNFNGNEGCVTQRKARQTKTLVGVYHSYQSGFETDPETPWATVCEAHGSIVCHSSLKAALSWAPDPQSWCQLCRHKDKRYRLDDEGEPFSFDDFLKNNENLDEYEKQQIGDLEVGETLTLGGGAAAEFVLRRVA